VPSVIIVAEPAADEAGVPFRDRRGFQLKEHVTSSDVSDPHVAAQLIERIGWALADAEDAERAARADRTVPPQARHELADRRAQCPS
jgi:hypothetical protein